MKNWLGLALSCGVILAVVIGGARALPLPGAEGAALRLDVGQAPLTAGADMPVFALGDGPLAAQVGRARFDAGGALAVSLYEDLDQAAVRSLPPLLLKVDARLLWAIASAENRTLLQANLSGLSARLSQTLEAIAASPTFDERYRPKLEAIVREAAGEAMQDPAVKAALDAVIAVLGEGFDNDFLSDYAGIIAKQGAQALVELSRFAPGLMADLLTGQRVDWDALKAELQRLLDSPEGHALVTRRLRAVLASEASAELATAFGRVLLGRLAADPRLLATLGDIAAEEAFQAAFKDLEAASLAGLVSAARLLAGVDRDDRLHPLAAAILRGLLFDEGAWLVAFVTPGRLRDLRAGGGVYPLFLAASQ